MQKKYILKMLGIQGNELKKINLKDNLLHLHIETNPKTHICPCCNNETKSIHDYRNQNIKHLKFGEYFSIIHIRKRRYICNHCSKKFYEQYDFLTKYRRISNKLALNIIDMFKQQLNFKQIANMNNLSSQTVINYLKFSMPNYVCNYLPKAIGIDEFRGNSGGNKFQLVIIDLDTNKVIDILPERNTSKLKLYLNKISNRKDVKFVCMDMCKIFKNAVKECLPNAKIICDKFHYTRLICWGLEKVRKKVQKNLTNEERLFFKRSKKILLAHKEYLNIEQKHQLNRMLDISEDLRWAYSIKERFYSISKASNYEEKVKLFNDWIFYASNCNMIEFNSHITSMVQWSKYIKNSFKYDYSNGITEGLNNKIKVIKRMSYGFRNFNNFRKRILALCS